MENNVAFPKQAASQLKSTTGLDFITTVFEVLSEHPVAFSAVRKTV